MFSYLLTHLHGPSFSWLIYMDIFTRSPPHPLTDLHGPPISLGSPTLPLPSLVSSLLLLLVLFFKLLFRLSVPHNFTVSNPVATLHKNVSQLQRRKGRPFWRDDFRIRRGNWHFCQTLESFRFKGCHRILKLPFPPLFLFSLLFDPTPALRAVCQKPNREGIRILSQIYSR